MRKSLILAAVLMGAAVVSFPFALAKVDSGKEKILITEEVLYGDPSEATGITLKIPVHWNGQLLWDTEYTIGSGKEAASRFTYSGHVTTWWLNTEIEAGLRIAGISASFVGNNGYLDWDPGIYTGMIQAVEGRTEKGEKHTETVRIRDYDPNYPLAFDINGQQSVWYQGDYDVACDYLTRYFHIPTAEDRMEVTVEKNQEGGVNVVRCSMIEDDDSISLVSAAADGGEGIYYVYGLQNVKTEESMDRGQNRGIFYFPYEEGGGGIWNVDLTRVRKVSDFPEDAVPIKMLSDEEEEILYLAVREREGYSLFLYHLEGETPVLTQKIPVDRNNLSGNMSYLRELADNRQVNENGSGVEVNGGFSSSGSTASGWAQMETTGSVSYEPPYFCRMFLVDGGVLMTWSDNSFSFVAKEEGQYRWWCDGVFPEAVEAEYYDDSSFPKENVCIFDGERLILAAYESWYRLNVIVAVYGETGQTYAGRYLHSLDRDRDMGAGSYYDPYNSIRPQGYREHSMYWMYGGRDRSDRREQVEPLILYY